MDERGDASPLLVFIIYCVHLLPYFGSASNWILYGLLNTQLQMKHEVGAAGQSHANVTMAAMGTLLGDDRMSTITGIAIPNGSDVISNAPTQSDIR